MQAFKLSVPVLLASSVEIPNGRYDVRKLVNLKLCLFNNLESDVRLTRTTLRLTMLAGSCRAFIGLLLLVSCA